MRPEPRKRIVAAALVLVAAGLLRYFEVPPLPTWFYVVAWYPTLVILDQIVVLLGGESLLAHPGGLVAMLWWSTVIWFVFEAINFRLQNWYYVFLPANRLARWVGITISLATVVPAVLLPERLLDRLGVWRELGTRPVALGPEARERALWLGGAALLAVLGYPRYFFPLTWGALWLITEPLLYQVDPAHSLFADVARGSWGRIARLMASGLFAGLVWETFNAAARGRWIYTVPFLERFKIFEMPPIGFLGFPFFALEAWSLYHLLARYTTRRTVSASLAFVLLVLLGMDRWTVSSTEPRFADLPGVTNGVLERLRAAGWSDVFAVARAPAAELAYTAKLSPEDARAAHDAARLVTLRGLGTAHAAALVGGGITSVPALAHADPDRVWRLTNTSARPTEAEVRVWIRAAEREEAAARAPPAVSAGRGPRP